ncbi:DUF3515 family protein [Microbacterium sp. STN6]|uniref:DUF3515 family protein n=1 Tax=Microbacterium sp. STN6 TaxID=2995588 RepID=UPI002260E955|nr:DUF3515 family protein [Microbacterium sp. STN6]MCX7522092.1 DUF3515 family protein [Microbacterium sp. STN6]
MLVIARPAHLLAALPALALALLLAGCAPTVSLSPGADANNPRCAAVTVRLPDTVASLKSRETDAQATGAWGDPAAVLLRCGVASPPPTTDRCVSALGIDWIVDDANDRAVRYTTYGRTPAIEVLIDHTKVSDSTVLADLKPAVTTIPQTRKCLGAADALAAPTTAPTPSVSPTAPASPTPAG